MFEALIRRYFDEYERHESTLASAGSAPVSLEALLPPKDDPDERATTLVQGAVLKAAARLRSVGNHEAAGRLLEENRSLLRRSTSCLASDEVDAMIAEGGWRAWELLLAFVDRTRQQLQANERFRSALEKTCDLPPEIEALLDD